MTVVAGLILFALLLALLYPGMLNMDSAGMLEQAMKGQFNDWHSPAVSLLWRGLNHLYPGPASLLALGLGLYTAGAGWFAVRAAKGPIAGIVVLLFLCLWPPLLNDLSLVGKDQAFIACLVPFIALVWQAKSTGRLTSPMLALLAALVFAACAVRRDTPVCLIPALALLYRLPAGNRAKGFGWGMAGALAVLSVVAGFVLAGAFDRHVARAYRMFPLQTTLVHDLAGISARTDLYLMPSYVDPAFDLTAIKERYTPVSGDPVLFDLNHPIVKIVADKPSVRDLERTWLSAVLRHPRAYLLHRLAAFSELLGIDDPAEYQLYQANTDAGAAKWHALPPSMHVENPDNAVLALYRQSIMPVLLPTPVFRGYAYDILLLVLMGLALARRRGAPDAVILALGAGALLHQAALFLASPAALFRYLYPSVLLVVAMTVLTVTGLRIVPGRGSRFRLTFSQPNQTKA